MKSILIFLSGIVFMFLVAATPQGRSIMIVEPMQPVSTVILYQQSYEGTPLEKQAIPYLQKGYIVRQIALYSYQGRGGYMVLEKY